MKLNQKFPQNQEKILEDQEKKVFYFINYINNGNIQVFVFRKVLLNKCQDEFEKYSQKQEKLPEELGIKFLFIQYYFIIFIEERMIAKEKAKRTKLGNVKFIGELYKDKLLSEKIIHSCIKGFIN